MKYKKTNKGYIIRLFKEEELMSTLTQFCKREGIHSGIFHGIGAVLSVEIGFYDLEKKEYLFKTFDMPLEIVSMTGNVALLQDEPFLHVHGVFSDKEMKTIGGHVKNATVGATCEVFLTDYGIDIEREKDEEIWLNLLKL